MLCCCFSSSHCCWFAELEQGLRKCIFLWGGNARAKGRLPSAMADSLGIRAKYEQTCPDCGGADFVEDHAQGDLICTVRLAVLWILS